MSVRLRIETRTMRGRIFERKLRTYQELMDCHSPGDHNCDVVVEEARRRQFDVIVTLPGYAWPPDDSWFVIKRDCDCRYVRSFDNPTPAVLASSILHLIAVPLTQVS